MKKTKTIVMMFSLLLPALTSAGSEVRTLKMKIEGMTCGMCVKKVEYKLAPLCKKELSVDLKKGEGLCRYETPVTEWQVLTEANKTGLKTMKLN